MITATVRYKLPAHIDYAACRAHFHTIAPDFRDAKGARGTVERFEEPALRPA